MLRAWVNGSSSSNWPTRRFSRVLRQLQQAADIDELEIAIAQSAIAVRPG